MSKVLKQACIALALLLIGGMLSMLSMSAASAAPVTASPVVSATKSDDGVKKQASNDDCDTEKTNSGDTEYTYETCAEASGSVKVKAKASGKAKVDSKGRLVLSFIMPGGLPESQQNQCKVIPAGQKYTNNYYDSTGAERWVTKTAPPGGVKICFTGGKWRVVKCGNVVIMKPPPAIKKKIYKGRYVVRSKQRIYSEAVAKATGKSTSHVKAVQAAGPCKGSEATASAVGSFFAIARARAWGWSKSSSLTALQGEIDRLNLQQSVENQAKANAKAQARGKAKTEVDAKIVCNTPPQEPTYQSPTINAQAKACVYEGQQTGVIDVVVGNPNNVAGNGPVTVGSQTKQVNVPAASTASVSFSGYAPGTYSVSVTLQPFGKSATTTVTVNKCDKPPHSNPLVEVNAPAHVVINPGDVDPTAHVWARVKVSDGASASVQTPQVSPSSLGYVSEWRRTGVDNEGWITYAGTFHASGQEGQACLTVSVSDSMGGSATSQPACITIVKDGGADV